MSELVPDKKNKILGLLHDQGGSSSLPQPFVRDVFLFDTFVAGTTHIEGMDELASHLAIGDDLAFYREPNNRYDELAIVIRTSAGVKIGYIPREDNAVFARLMDAGKLLFGRISTIDQLGSWHRIGIGVYLRD